MLKLCSSPRVVGKIRPDYFSLESIVKSPKFLGKSGEELALAIYNHFTSTLDGSYHSWRIEEQSPSPRLRRTMFDPLKMLNVYGFMICGMCSTLLYHLYRAAGLQARQYSINGHNLCEVYYEGRWHHLDVDMWNWYRTPEGHIASAFELSQAPQQLIVTNLDKSDPSHLPDRTLEGYAEAYSGTKTHGDELFMIWPHWQTRAHTMDFYLRPGEQMTRSQTNTGRFYMPQDWKGNIKAHASEWKGFPYERYAPFRSFGNGTWTYQPRLESRYHDYEIGVWQSSGILQTTAGLEVAKGVESGTAIFRILSPYPFCGFPDWSSEKVISRDGVWLDFSVSDSEKYSVHAEVTDAEGAWQKVPLNSANRANCNNSGESKRSDITLLMDGRYECLIRFTLQAGATLERFKFHGYTMTAPMSLPRLETGENEMQLCCLDSHHGVSEPWSEILDFRSNAEVQKQFVALENARVGEYTKGWQQIEPENAKSGPLRATACFTAPVGRKFSWFYVAATIRESAVESPSLHASLEWSTDGIQWQPISTVAIPQTRMQWDGSVDGEVVCVKPLSKIYVRASSQTALSVFEFYGHLEIPQPHQGVVKVRHDWVEDSEDAKAASSVKNCEFIAPIHAMKYCILCAKNPRDHRIEMSVDSLLKF